jgi:hypothetical protein
MQTKIDLSKIRSEDGTYSESDLKAIEKVTGKSVSELLEEQKRSEKQGKFTREEIANMTPEEYAKNRDEILKTV